MDNRDLLQEISRQIDASAKETREYVDTTSRASAKQTGDFVEARIQEAVRELRVVIEDSDRPIRVNADGHMILAEKVDGLARRMEKVEGRVDRLGTEVVALRSEVRAGNAALRDEMRAGAAALHEELGAFRTEVRGEFAEVRRVARLEATVGDLAARVGRLEGRTAR